MITQFFLTKMKNGAMFTGMWWLRIEKRRLGRVWTAFKWQRKKKEEEGGDGSTKRRIILTRSILIGVVGRVFTRRKKNWFSLILDVWVGLNYLILGLVWSLMYNFRRKYQAPLPWKMPSRASTNWDICIMTCHQFKT